MYVTIGQLYLPMKTLCTTAFLVEILEGKKQVFQSFEIDPVNVPNNKYTTKKQLTKMIQNHAELKKYFPKDPTT